MTFSTPSSPSFARLGAAIGLAACLAVAGCGSSSSQSDAPKSAKQSALYDAQIAGQVPATIRDKGVLKIGTSADFAPIEFIGTDGQSIQGLDPDLADAIGQVLGLKAQMINSSYDSLTPSLSAGRYDVVMAGVQDVKDREKSTDFINYMQMGTQFYVKADGGPSINTLSDLCGHAVAAQKGTTQQSDAEAQNKKCGGSVKVQVFNSQNEVNLAVQSGRADVGMADAAPVLYQVAKSSGKLKVSGEPYAVARDGIIVPKGSKLVAPLQAAVNKLISSGEYLKILKKWDVEDVAIKQAVVNGATS